MFRLSSLLSMMLVFTALGCGKKPESKNNGPDTTPPPAAGPSQPSGTPGPNSDPKYVSSAGGNNPVIPNQNGNLTVKGGEGAIQGPRMALARLVNQVELRELYLGMFQTFQLDNRVPDVNEVMNDAKQNSKLFPLLKEEVIILTGTKLGNGVWAYSQYPQRSGDHYVVTSQGVSNMSPAELKNRLTQEKSPIKMSQ